MKGYWHIPAIAVVVSIFNVHFSHYWSLILFLIWISYLYFSNRLGKTPIILSLACYIFFYSYIPSPDLNFTDITEPETGDIQGTISSEVDVSKQKVEFTLRKETGQNTLILFFPQDSEDSLAYSQYSHLKYGAACTVPGAEQLPDESRNPGQFNYREYLLTRDITTQIIVSSLDEITCEGSAFFHRFYSLRATLFRYVEENINPYTAAWLNALVLGNDDDIADDTIELFQRWSLSHILAISGLHVGIIISVVYFLLIKLNLATKEKAAWIMLLFLPVYAIVAGGEPSVWRASTMVFLFIILNKLKLHLILTDVLSIVFLLLTLSDPYIIYHVGFQLSFTVTFGLLLSRSWIASSGHMLFQTLQISFIAQMMILPLLMNYFSYFQPLSILLNVIVVPYFSFLVIPGMFLILITAPISMLSGMFDYIFLFVHRHFLNFIKFIDAHFSFPWITGSMPLTFIVGYYGFLLIMMFHMEKNNRKKSFVYGICICLLMTGLLMQPYLSSEGRITMLDIGQGDAFVIELPYRRGVFMIDAGARYSFEDMEPNNNVYKQIIKPYLYSRGIQKIDAVFISHEDMDHMGSVSFMVEELDIDQILVSEFYQFNDQTALHWLENNVDIKRISHREGVELGGQYFHVLAPVQNQEGANENSLVLYTEAGGKQWLFTGDIGKKEEIEIIEHYPNLSVDVLKVAHHGSDTSTGQSFIDAINPKYALIPVGINNSYGHPSSEVLTRLEESVILRTDKNGAVQFRFKQNEGTFYKFMP
ncbi:DNA internalization-related competence protein ComEC/Rec2 [Virgibacillus oceani]